MTAESKFPFIQDRNGKWWEQVAFSRPQQGQTWLDVYGAVFRSPNSCLVDERRPIVVEVPELPKDVYLNGEYLVNEHGGAEFDVIEKFDRYSKLFPPYVPKPKPVPWDSINDIPDGCHFFERSTGHYRGQLVGENADGRPTIGLNVIYTWDAMRDQLLHGPSHKTPVSERKECVKEPQAQP